MISLLFLPYILLFLYFYLFPVFCIFWSWILGGVSLAPLCECFYLVTTSRAHRDCWSLQQSFCMQLLYLATNWYNEYHKQYTFFKNNDIHRTCRQDCSCKTRKSTGSPRSSWRKNRRGLTLPTLTETGWWAWAREATLHYIVSNKGTRANQLLRSGY